MLFWVLHHNLRKNHCSDKHAVDNYLIREDKANQTRRKDLTGLAYITIPDWLLSFDITLNDTKKQSQFEKYISEIQSLSDKKMLNLIGITNTELKETYGPANLELLTTYDQNYSRYIRSLHQLAANIFQEYPDHAVAILEYCLSIGTDISGTYDLLGTHYLTQGDLEHFMALYDKIPQKESLAGKVIQNKLNRLKENF